MLLNNVNDVLKEFAMNDLVIYENLIYDALNYEYSTYSVSMSFKYLGHFEEALTRMFFNQKIITKTEYDVYNDYLHKVLETDCYNNMYSRMKVRGEYER